MKHATDKEPNSRGLDNTCHTKTHRYDLTDVSSRINQVNCYPEYQTGPAQGKKER